MENVSNKKTECIFLGGGGDLIKCMYSMGPQKWFYVVTFF